MAREFSKVGVVGLGTMGAGIAEVLARSGLQVVGVEHDQAGVERARGHLATSTAMCAWPSWRLCCTYPLF